MRSDLGAGGIEVRSGTAMAERRRDVAAGRRQQAQADEWPAAAGGLRREWWREVEELYISTINPSMPARPSRTELHIVVLQT